MRDNVISKFFEFFCNAITEIQEMFGDEDEKSNSADMVKVEKELKLRSSKLAQELELEMHKAFPETKPYQTKARMLLFNLNDSKNPQLRQKLLKGDLFPK